MDLDNFQDRKRDHIRLALKEESQKSHLSLWDRYTFDNEALPNLDLQDVCVDCSILSWEQTTPFFINSMTAGHADSLSINQKLAKACQEKSWFMGVGSQRRELSDPLASQEWKKVRQYAPGVHLLGNIGLTQLIETPIEEIQRLCDVLEAQAMIVHLNALQEAVQPEGTPQFKGGLEALTKLCRVLPVPVVVKETGHGMSVKTIKALILSGVKAIDVSGLGGTHWGTIETERTENILYKKIAKPFSSWGIDTVTSLINAQNAFMDIENLSKSDHFLSAEEALFDVNSFLKKAKKQGVEIWASGGVRTGLDAAKAIALGANAVGFAQPILKEVKKGEEALYNFMYMKEQELKLTLFCTGSLSLSEIKGELKYRRVFG